MAQKKHWNGLADLKQSPEQQQNVEKEFQDELPILNMGEKLLNATTPRRDFLKYVGFSTLAATVAASCEMPVRHAIPFAIKPDNETPGIPNYYASSFVDNGDYCAVVVKQRDGRPIMVEGNTLSPITKGRSTARSIASTLSLYDSARLRQPYVDGKSVDSFNKVDNPIAQALSSGSGTIYVVTGSVLSPTTDLVISQFLAKYPNAKHIQYDPVSYSGMLLANEMNFGKKSLPSYHFDKAKSIFSIGADFLGTWLSPAEFTMGYTVNRKVSAKNPVMSKHYQVEAMMTITGAAADERAVCKPSEYGKVAAALYQAITTGAASSFSSKKLNTMITNAAKDLKSGNGLVVSGSNDVNVQVIVNAINNAIGANGNTVNWAIQSNYKKGLDTDMNEMVTAMNAGSVSAVLFHKVNPVYDYCDQAKMISGLKKVNCSISFNDRMDETTKLCKFAVPDNHWLESWGDAEPKTGYFSFIQPTIAPLFKTRAFQDSLLKWASSTDKYHDIWNQFWIAKLGGQKNFDQALQDGVANPAEYAFASAPFSGDVNAAIGQVTNTKEGKYEVVVYESIALGYGGSWSNNPWLQEMPDPVSKVTWDNFACMSPKTAREQFDAAYEDHNEDDRKRRVVKVKVGNTELALPVVVIPGMHNEVVAVALGYGRSKEVGMAANNIGKNAYPFTSFNGQTRSFFANADITKTEEKYPIAITQAHLNYENRPIIHEFTLSDFKKNPRHLIEERNEELQAYSSLQWDEKQEDANADFDEEGFRKNGTMYPVHPEPGIHWGMSIDLNSCTGCGACTVACQAENNVSVVGKKQVLAAHEMAWLRIDRYFSGNPDDPDTIQAIFQPMLCQHCDNAPCENVCPVSATNHSSEGLNQMIYNRCIGTKYCANNCPYKVRRFNWFDWNGADSFADNLYEDGIRDAVNDDLERMVLNPEVTVRARGVMEKCTMCVQRLQGAKLVAKKAGEPMVDGTAKTACQVACASDAIKFGNFNDKNSEIYKVRNEENKERLFHVLESLHTLPNVSYLSRIRNTEEVIAGTEEDGMFQQHI